MRAENPASHSFKSTHYRITLGEHWLVAASDDHRLFVRSNRGIHRGPGHHPFFLEVLRRLTACRTTEEMTGLLGGDNFADLTLVYVRESCCLIKSDIIRTWPLFYRQAGGVVELSDIPLPDWKGEIGAQQLAQFIAMGYVIGDKTIYEGVHALQSSEIVVFEQEGKRQCSTFTFRYDEKPVYTKETDPGVAGRELDSILTGIFRDTVATVPEGSRIVVPLSGGHDSRIVLNYLHKLGCRNVLCYTYGVEGTLQAKISRQLAQALGYEWHFMEYTEAKWQQLRDTGEFERYLAYGFRGVSNPLISDLLPVWQMKREGILKEGDIFIPGHGLDYLSGNDLTEADFECTTEEEAIELVFRNSVRSGDLEHTRQPALWEPVSRVYRESGVGPVPFHLHFFWQEDEAKFIVNSNRLYEYFGFDTRIPLLDIRLIRFWLSVDQRLNIRREFLFSLEREWLHVPAIRAIPFDREVQRETGKTAEPGIKKWIPNTVKTFILRITKRKRVIDEGQNLVFAGRPETLADLCGRPEDWPEPAGLFFRNDLKRFTHQLPPHFVTRLHLAVGIIRDVRELQN